MTEIEQPKEQISVDNAQKQLEMIFDYYEVDIEDYAGIKVKGTNVQKTLEFAKKKLLKSIRRGRLEVGKDDSGRLSIVQHLQGSYATLKTIEYKPLKAKDKIAMGNEDEDNNHAQMYALLASMSGIESGKFGALEGKDLTTAECLGNFFLLG
jgi:hypothetical protein